MCGVSRRSVSFLTADPTLFSKRQSPLPPKLLPNWNTLCAAVGVLALFI